jgi:putative membrane protein
VTASLLGTRADLLVDLVLALNLTAPVAMLWSFGIARRRGFARHRRVQLVLLACCILAVLCLEARIRLAGGSGALVGASPFAGTPLFRGVFAAHVSGAVLTYATWGLLAWSSTRRFGRTLPGPFATTHRRIGLAVFTGMCFTALSASAIYVLGFVL